MSRFAFAFAVIGCVVPTLAQAQQPGHGPPMTVAMDLKKVTLGSWAEYSVTVGKMPAMKTRMSLVAKGGPTHTIEMAVEGGMLAMAGGSMVMQTEVDADLSKDAPVKRLIMQMGQNDPMEMPLTTTQQKQFKKPNPKSLLKEESITVAAGTFKAKHYRDKTEKGDVFDVWVSEKAPPFGLIKIEGEQKGGPPGAEGAVVFELTSLGGGAKSTITKKAKPFDQAAFMGQMMNGSKGGGPGAPPSPSSPPPSSPSSPSSPPAKKP
jgi:hypothetical protein